MTLKAKNSVNSSTKEKEGYVYVVSAEKLVLYLPFDGDNKDAGPNQLNPEELTAGAGSSVYNSQARFSGESAECRFAAHFQGDKQNYSILSIPEEGLKNHYTDSEFTEFLAFNVTLYFPGLLYCTTGFCSTELAGVPPSNVHSHSSTVPNVLSKKLIYPPA